MKKFPTHSLPPQPARTRHFPLTAGGPARLIMHCGLLSLMMLTAMLLQGIKTWKTAAIVPDGTTFIRIAKQLETTPLQTLRRSAQHPGYPVAILAAQRFVPGDEDRQRWERAAHFVASICAALLIPAIWLLTWQMVDARTAYVAAAMTTFLPLLRHAGSEAISDSLHFLVYTLALSSLLQATRSGRIGWFAVTGAASGLAYLVRPEGGSIALVAAGVLAIELLRPRVFSRRQAGQALLATVAATLVLTLPYILIKGSITEKLTQKQFFAQSAPPSQNKLAGATNGLVANEQPAEKQVLPVQAAPATIPVADGQARIRVDRSVGRFLELLMTRVAESFHLLLAPLILAVLVRKMPAMPHRWGLVLLLVTLIHLGLLSALFQLGGYIERRHLIPLCAVIIPSAAGRLVDLAGLIATPADGFALASHSRRWGRTLVWGFCAAFAAVSIPFSTMNMSPHAAVLVDVGNWIKEQHESAEELFCNYAIVGFYSDRHTRQYRSAQELDARLRQAVSKQPCIVVIDQRDQPEHERQPYRCPPGTRLRDSRTWDTERGPVTALVVEADSLPREDPQDFFAPRAPATDELVPAGGPEVQSAARPGNPIR